MLKGWFASTPTSPQSGVTIDSTAEHDEEMHAPDPDSTVTSPTTLSQKTRIQKDALPFSPLPVKYRPVSAIEAGKSKSAKLTSGDKENGEQLRQLWARLEKGARMNDSLVEEVARVRSVCHERELQLLHLMEERQMVELRHRADMQALRYELESDHASVADSFHINEVSSETIRSAPRMAVTSDDEAWLESATPFAESSLIDMNNDMLATLNLLSAEGAPNLRAVLLKLQRPSAKTGTLRASGDRRSTATGATRTRCTGQATVRRL